MTRSRTSLGLEADAVQLGGHGVVRAHDEVVAQDGSPERIERITRSEQRVTGLLVRELGRRPGLDRARSPVLTGARRDLPSRLAEALPIVL